MKRCQHRTPKPVATLKPGCSRCNIYRCAKYGTYCTLVTPQQYGLPIIVDGVASGDRLTRENGRACSICRAAGEDE